MQVIKTVEPERVAATELSDTRLLWFGLDDRGIELEIAALDLDDVIVVLHVMPTSLRRCSGERDQYLPARGRHR